jgi:hypothetical protein
MRKIDPGQAVGIVANVAVVAGIIFLGLEIRQTGLAIQDNSHLSSIEYAREVRRQLLDPDFAAVYEQALVNYEGLSPSEKRQFAVFVNQHINLWEYAFHAKFRGTMPEANWILWDNYFRTEIVKPGWRPVWRERRSRQDDDFAQHVNAIVDSQ